MPALVNISVKLCFLLRKVYLDGKATDETSSPQRKIRKTCCECHMFLKWNEKIKLFYQEAKKHDYTIRWRYISWPHKNTGIVRTHLMDYNAAGEYRLKNINQFRTPCFPKYSKRFCYWKKCSSKVMGLGCKNCGKHADRKAHSCRWNKKKAILHHLVLTWQSI